MYYRVKQFSQLYKNMFVIDSDTNLNRLQNRTHLQDCGKPGPRPFNNPQFVMSQQITCTSLGGATRMTDIIKD